MAFVAEVDTKLVGMYFLLRRFVGILSNGGFQYALAGGGAMATPAVGMREAPAPR